MHNTHRVRRAPRSMRLCSNFPPLPPPLQLFDVRMQRELVSFRGHNRDVTHASWHPTHEELFVSGGHDGSMIFWLAGRQVPQVGRARRCLPSRCCSGAADAATPLVCGLQGAWRPAFTGYFDGACSYMYPNYTDASRAG